ncbi:MAG: hypothetical protein ACYS8I_16585 [Planctomycetota bacterium]|jgi:hypothetical protein
MNEFVKQNQRLLHFYSVAAQSTAVVLLILAPIFIIAGMFSGGRFSSPGGWPSLMNLLTHVLLSYIGPSSLALLVAQFIRYLREPEYRAGWILRHGTAILYVVAVLVAVNSVWRWFFFAVIIKRSTLDAFSTWPGKLLTVLVSLLLTALGVLVLVGLAQILKRTMPIIEESKTLV